MVTEEVSTFAPAVVDKLVPLAIVMTSPTFAVTVAVVPVPFKVRFPVGPAIPAVLAFNHYTAKGEEIYSDRALFSEEMVALLQRQSVGTTQEAE